MTVWGKLAGAAAGLALGGPLGALLGGVAGHFADRAIESPEDKEARLQIAFTAGVIALGAKMAKADGRVTRDEIAAFREVFVISERDSSHVSRLFNLAKQDVAGYEAYADQLAQLFRSRPQLLEDVLDGLFHIAVADHVLHPSEERFLSNVAERFGLDVSQYRTIRSRHVISNDISPYDVLQVSPDIDDASLKRRYRQLVAAHHPDKLAASGLPKEFFEVANQRLATINAAYDDIKRERGL
jgi:DnaJ like chaperone protein